MAQSGDYRSQYRQNRRSYLQMLLLAGSSGGLASLAGCTGGDAGGDTPTATAAGDGEPTAVPGETAAERALNAAERVAEDADKSDIQVLFSSGASGNFEAVRDTWESRTGTTIKLNPVADVSVAKKANNIMATRSSDMDVMMVPPKNLPNLVEGGLAKDLTNLGKKYKPTPTGDEGVLEPLFLQNLYKRRLHILMSDGDTMHLHLRTPWLEDEDNQAAYEDQFGQELRPPETVQELDQQIKFFGQQEGKHGAFFFMSPFWLKWTFRRRFIKHGELLWNDDFSPNFNGDLGVQVINELKELKQYMPENVDSAAVSEYLQSIAEGNVYAAYGWPALSKFLNNPETSQISDPGDWQIYKAPGTKLDDGTLFRPEQFTFGWGFIVSNFSKIQELGYLFSQWMYSPSISLEHISAQGGYLDPFRKNHLQNEELMSVFKSGGEETQQYIDTYIWNVEHTYPELIVQGAAEYYDAIDTAVNNAINNDKDPKTELDKAAEKAEEITEKFGRDSQIEQWESLKSTYGKPLREALGLPDPPAFIEEI